MVQSEEETGAGRPLKICLVSRAYPPVGSGGIARYVYELAHGLAETGQTVHVIAEATAGDSGERRDGPVMVHRIWPARFPLPAPLRRKGRGIWHLLERSLAVYRAIRRIENASGPFDIVEMPNWGAEGLVYSLFPRAPLVVRLSTPMAVVGQMSGVNTRRVGFRLHSFLENWPVRHAAYVIANSNYIAEYFTNNVGISPHKISVVPHGMRMPSGKTPRPSERSGSLVTVLFVGRLEPRKGIQFLLQAIPRVLRAEANVRFLIVGRETGMAPENFGSFQEYFRSFADPRALQATTFVGFVSQETLERLYASCDIFVAPSLFESFGLIYLEAMGWGKPVVAFRAGAAEEIIVDGQTGILVRSGNVAGLAEAIVALAREPERRRKMGEAGRERALSQFSREKMVARTMAVYRKVLVEERKHG